MAITKKGSKWEFKHSLWIIWSFILLLDGLGLVLAGNKTRVKKWRNAGLFYIILAWLSMLIGANSTGFISNTMDVIFVILYPACIIHSFLIRKEYLIRLELLENQNAEQLMADELRIKYANEYGINTNSSPINEIKFTNKIENVPVMEPVSSNNLMNNQGYTVPLEATDHVMNVKQPVQNLVDINTCSEEDLLQLPGVGIIEAKKIMNYRNNHEFNSIEEFIEILNIKPHFTEEIRPMLTCNKPIKNTETEYTNQENKTGGSIGRMVDF